MCLVLPPVLALGFPCLLYSGGLSWSSFGCKAMFCSWNQFGTMVRYGGEWVFSTLLSRSQPFSGDGSPGCGLYEGSSQFPSKTPFSPTYAPPTSWSAEFLISDFREALPLACGSTPFPQPPAGSHESWREPGRGWKRTMGSHS